MRRMIDLNTIYNESNMDTMRRMPDNFLHCVVTSPPYWGLRDYGTEGTLWPPVSYAPLPGLPPITIEEQTVQLGLEETPEAFVAHIVHIFREVHRVLREDGTLWLNFGDSYNTNGAGNKEWGNGVGANKHYQEGSIPSKRNVTQTLKPKDLCGIPWRIAFALQADGWYLRSDIIWNKPNPMPESVTDRPTKAHEYLFLLTKSPRYFYDAEAVKEPATTSGIQNSFARTANTCPSPKSPMQHRPDRDPVEYSGTKNRRSVWTISTQPYSGAHFAVFPPDLVKPCVLAGSPKDGIVYDPFGGSGTTAEVAHQYGRNWIISEISEKYVKECTQPRLEKTKQQVLF